MEWDNDTVLRFIELYQSNPCIWDPENKGHKNRPIVNEAWNSIQEELGSFCSVIDLKKKKESLMSGYRLYKARIRSSERSGGPVYKPTWFAFHSMDSFLGPLYSTYNSFNIENESVVIQEQQDTNDLNATRETDDSDHSEQNKPRPSTSSTRRRLIHVPCGSQKRRSRPAIPLKKRRLNRDVIQVTSRKDSQTIKDDDESTVFGVLIAKKLRNLSEERRDKMMVKISQLFVDERQYHNRRISKTTRSQTSSPPVFFQASPESYSSDDNYVFTENTSNCILSDTENKHTPSLQESEIQSSEINEGQTVKEYVLLKRK